MTRKAVRALCHTSVSVTIGTLHITPTTHSWYLSKWHISADVFVSDNLQVELAVIPALPLPHDNIDYSTELRNSLIRVASNNPDFVVGLNAIAALYSSGV